TPGSTPTWPPCAPARSPWRRSRDRRRGTQAADCPGRGCPGHEGLAMASSPRQVGDGPATTGKPFPLTTELSVAEGDPLSGIISVAGGQPATPFHGWIDLMSAINSLRAEVSPPHSLPGHPANVTVADKSTNLGRGNR